MIAILVEYVGVVLKYAIEKGLDFGTSELKKRRSVLAKLLVLYNSVHELRIESSEVIREFEGYANGTEVATKVVAAKRLQHLLAAFNSFRVSSGEVSKALDIYDHELSAMVRSVQGAKMATFWKVVDVTEGVVPKMEEIEGRKTYILAFPTKLPTLNIADKVDAGIVDNNALVV